MITVNISGLEEIRNKIASIAFLFATAGCASKKVQTQTTETLKSNEVVNTNIKTESAKSVDTTHTFSLETNTVKVEFFNPNEIQNYDSLLQMMRDIGSQYADAGIPKSITKDLTKSEQTKQGITNETNSIQIDSSRVSNIEAQKVETVKTETISFWDKYKWYFIVGGIVAVAVIAALKFRK